MSHAQLVRALMADRWGCVDVESHALLANLSPVERAAVMAEVVQLLYGERHERRLEMLRERLVEWKPEYWGQLFSECAELQAELTPGQRAQWEEHLAGIALAKRRATSLVTMPPPKRGPELSNVMQCPTLADLVTPRPTE